jgi:ABC-type nitrate/sulfonate/bicarbonate transport system permease component
MPRRLDRFLKGLTGVVLSGVLWQAALAVGLLPRAFTPTVLDVVRAAAAGLLGGDLLFAAADTIEAWAFGLAIAICLAVPFGLLLGLSRLADDASGVVVRFMRPIPSVALIPVAILFAGLGLSMKLILVVFACSWPLLFNSRYGVRHVEPLLLDTGRVFGVSGLALVRWVVLPSALPSIFTGLRVSSAIALVVAIAAELVSGSGGLGQYILSARVAGQVPETYAAIFIGGLLSYAANAGVLALEGWLLAWNVGYREATA